MVEGANSGFIIIFIVMYASLYILYLIFRLILFNKNIHFQEILNEILILIFYYVLFFILLNKNLLKMMLGINPLLFSNDLAAKKINAIFVESMEYLDELSKIALFIAVVDIVISLTSIVFPGSVLSLIASYRPYTHLILSLINGVSQIIGIIIIMIIILITIIHLSFVLNKYLLLFSMVTITIKRTRIIGKTLLAYYIILAFILPFSINTALNNTNTLKISVNIPNFTTKLDKIKIHAFTANGEPLHAPIIVVLQGNNTYYMETVYDGKTIVLPRGIYKGLSACIYWKNFSNSPCCFKTNYTECYKCYLTSIINSSKESINIILPYSTIPCNRTLGVSGLFYEVKGPQPFINGGYLKFTLTPKNKILDVKVIGGIYEIEFLNNSAWKIYYSITPGEYYPQCSNALLYKALLQTSLWQNRTNLGLYGNFTPKIGSLSNTPIAYRLKVWLEKVNDSNCSKNIVVNVTIYGRGCWNPNIAYIDSWNKVVESERSIDIIGKYFLENYRLFLSIYSNLLLGSSVIFILMMLPLSTFISGNIILTASNLIYNVKIFNIKILNKRRKYKSVKDLFIPRSNVDKVKMSYKNIKNKVKKVMYKREIISTLRNPRGIQEWSATSLYLFLQSIYGLYALGELDLPREVKEILQKYVISTDKHLKYFIPTLNYKRIYVDTLFFINHVMTNNIKPRFLIELLDLREEVITSIMERNNRDYLKAIDIYNRLLKNNAIPDLDAMIVYYLLLIDDFKALKQADVLKIKQFINEFRRKIDKYSKKIDYYNELFNILNKLSDNYEDE